MSEGRRSEVLLLDGRRVELIIQPKLFAGDLFDIVASHFNLKEKEYFGLAFLDETCQYSWLNLDKRVLEHEYAKKHAHEKLILHFLVKYFVDSITQLNDKTSVELFYLQAKALVANEVIQVDADTFFRLAALVLQATYADYTNDNKTRSYLKKLHLIPTYILKDVPSLQVCEDKVIEEYKELKGQSRGHAIVKFMSIIEKQPTYGVHFYEIKDKTGIPYWLGLSYKGINQFDYNDRRIPRRSFLWKQLENLYFREKKFSIEVRDPKRVVHTLSSINLYENAIEESVNTIDDLSTAITDPTTQVSVSRRTFGPCNVTVYVWFAASAALTKCIWSMAIAQHQFYIDRRNSNKNSLCPPRSVEEIVSDLNANQSVYSPSSRSGDYSIRRSLSSHSLPTLRIEDEELIQLENNKAEKQKEMFETLKVRKEALEEAMNKKLAELKSLCLKEGELTGELPPETPLGSNEQMPQIRRRVGTAFTLNDKLLLKPKTKEEAILSKLELEYEIQSKIVSAASKLAKDATAKKNVRKQRKQAYQQALAKMKDLEGKLLSVKRQIATTRRQQSLEDLNEDTISNKSEGKCENSLNKYFITGNPKHSNAMHMKRSASLYSSSVPSTPTTKLANPENHSSRVRPSSPTISAVPTRMHMIQRPRSAAAKSEPTFDYDTDEESNEVLRNLDNDFDNVSSAGSSSGGTNSVIYIGEEKKKLHIQSPYVNKYEAPLNDGSNLYSVPNRRTSIALKSQDDSHLRHQSSPCQTSVKFHPNHNQKQLSEEEFQFNRSNSLDNSVSVRRGAASQRPIETNSPSFESHHQHYANHYPTYRMVRTDSQPESVPMSPTSVKSYQMAQRPLPTPPIPETHHKYIQTHPNVHNIDHSVGGHVGSDVIDGEHDSGRIPNYENISHLSSRAVTPSKFKTSAYPAVESHQVVRNASPHPPPQTPIAPKGWTETSLDFVLPSKPNKSNPNKQNTSHGLPPNARTITSGNATNVDSTKELYVNVLPIPTHMSQTSSLASPMLSPATSMSIPSAQSTPLASPQPSLIQSHGSSTHDINRNSIASSTRSIGGDSVSSKPSAIPLSPSIPSGNGVEVTVVSVGHFQPYWEEEKPFEMSDFFKYSQKHRKQQVTSPVPQTPPQHNQPSASTPLTSGQHTNGADVSGNSVLSPNSSLMNSSLLNESFKLKSVVSDSFTSELINWYDDKGQKAAVGSPERNDKKNATLV